jgi:nicotinamide mononucleotide transporter
VSILYWLTAVASLIGVWLNIHHHVACFWIWAVTNAVWAYADATHGLFAQATVQSAYLVLALYGIAKWRRPVSAEEPHDRNRIRAVTR